MLRREYEIAVLDTEEVAWLLGTDSEIVGKLVNVGMLKLYRTTHHGNRLFRRREVARLLERLGA